MANIIADHDDASLRRLTDNKCVPFNAVRQLQGNHRQLLRCVRELGSEQSTINLEVVQLLCDELTRYLKIKEHVFYPALREASTMPAFVLELDQSIVEHFSVQLILETLDGQGPGDALFLAKVRTLERHVIQHVEDEETRLFPLLGELPLTQLSRRMADYRQHLMMESGS